MNVSCPQAVVSKSRKPRVAALSLYEKEVRNGCNVEKPGWGRVTCCSTGSQELSGQGSNSRTVGLLASIIHVLFYLQRKMCCAFSSNSLLLSFALVFAFVLSFHQPVTTILSDMKESA